MLGCFYDRNFSPQHIPDSTLMFMFSTFTSEYGVYLKVRTLYKSQLIAEVIERVLVIVSMQMFCLKCSVWVLLWINRSNLLYQCNSIKIILLLLLQSIRWHCFLISSDVWPGFTLMLREGLILDWVFSGSCFLPLVLLSAGTDHFMELSGNDFSLT